MRQLKSEKGAQLAFIT